MMRSLWAGVSGLNAHQIAMDVEGDNIANVNTAGFKYSRVNFSDLLSQTSKIATAPQGELGGKNPMQVGLGTQVSSITTIFKQGSIQTTDKNTDLAIQGDGFFVVSPDGGKTYKFSRNGDFVFDADGNFVDSNGYVVQGWMRDPETGEIDSTAPIGNITIPPGLTTPANASSYINLKANLNSGNTIVNKSPIYSLDYLHNAVDLNGNGINDGGNEVHNENDWGSDIFNTDKKLYERSEDFGVLFNSVGEAFNIQENQGIWISYTNATYKQTVNQGSGNIDLTLNGTHISGDVTGANSDESAQKIAALINQKTSVTGVIATVNGSEITFTNNNSGTTENTKNIDLDINSDANTGLQSKEVYTAYRYQYVKGGAAPIQGTPAVDTAAAIRTFTTTEDLREAMQNDARNNVNFDSSDDAGEASESNTNDGVIVKVNDGGKYEITNPGNGSDDWGMNLTITSLTDPVNGVSANDKFTNTMSALQGNLPIGNNSRISQTINAATHASSIDIFDSLGTKHTVRFEFRKIGYTAEGGTQWSVVISVPEPGDINGGVDPKNIVTGQISFNSDGSLSSYTPTNLTYTANNGSSPNQNINLQFGTAGQFDGMTSFDATSNTSGISQDGYPGGDLNGIRVDETGTLIGSFTNGRSFGLAQVSMASFTNNVGLESDGGGVYIQTSNSGDPIIGQAATGKRGFIQASALEMSNVDLSRSLTQLIIIQRGFQANSKTITTSDQMLNTLLQLKQ
ncbi:MAG: flagellar hook protein FlgE [Epsilonproteobacteria bacterium]|nr:flagellar hook protein FlgE [Campylobacterota bacterium]